MRYEKERKKKEWDIRGKKNKRKWDVKRKEIRGDELWKQKE